jgi:hypothetical protein
MSQLSSQRGPRPGRHHVGIHGRHHLGMPGRLHRNRQASSLRRGFLTAAVFSKPASPRRGVVSMTPQDDAYAQWWVGGDEGGRWHRLSSTTQRKKHAILAVITSLVLAPRARGLLEGPKGKPGPRCGEISKSAGSGNHGALRRVQDNVTFSARRVLFSRRCCNWVTSPGLESSYVSGRCGRVSGYFGCWRLKALLGSSPTGDIG